ncbi:putative cytochrome c oxidase subunit 5C-4 isoform X1 [Punica granatum]|uniref:Cytochrome c oxidase subunit 5C-4 isoform X1 n=1 Tax=Punica granatum TaxID=22663 RepID=A0A6P8ED52_PUNGR|nr:putative cytochrome c oxidase subunit 5C-4 isoform X1 [Punica granatum]
MIRKTRILVQREVMAASHKVAHAAYNRPSILKEIIYGIMAGLAAGFLWKMHHWNNQRRTKEFYDLLERGEISVVLKDE